MIGNNSCGVHSLTTGRTSDNVEELEILTYDGLRLRVGATPERGDRPHRPRRRPPRRDLPPAARAAGPLRRPRSASASRASPGGSRASTSTSSCPSAASTSPAPSPARRGPASPSSRPPSAWRPRREPACWWCSAMPDIVRAAEHVPEVLAAEPIGLEGMDRFLVDNELTRRSYRETLSLLPPGNAWLLVEFGGADPARRRPERARRLAGPERPARRRPRPSRRGSGRCARRRWRRPRAIRAWATAGRAGRTRRCRPERFAAYLRDLLALLARYGYGAAFYGHFGEGCLHARIDFDFRTAGRRSAATAPSWRRRRTWWSRTAARSRASTATASSAASCSPACSARSWSRPSASSRRSGTRATG